MIDRFLPPNMLPSPMVSNRPIFKRYEIFKLLTPSANVEKFITIESQLVRSGMFSVKRFLEKHKQLSSREAAKLCVKLYYRKLDGSYPIMIHFHYDHFDPLASSPHQYAGSIPYESLKNIKLEIPIYTNISADDTMPISTRIMTKFINEDTRDTPSNNHLKQIFSNALEANCNLLVFNDPH